MPRLQLTVPVPLFALAVVAAASGLALPAHASCVGPMPSIVWSYPRDGQTEVPTNATIWLLLSSWHRPPTISLDGKELPVNAFGFGYLPTEPLAPSTNHVITLAAPGPSGAPVSLSLRFTTASGETEREPPAVPTVTSVVASQARPLDLVCQGVVHAMDCFDTGQDTHLMFVTEGRPLLWIVERIPQAMGESPRFDLWPGECQVPEIFVHDSVSRACGARYRLHAIEGTGLRAMSPPFCPAELVKPATPDQDGGVAPPEDDGGVPATADAGAPEPPPPGGMLPGGAQANPQVKSVDGGDGGCSFGGGAGTAGGVVLLLMALMAVAALRRRRQRAVPR